MLTISRRRTASSLLLLMSARSSAVPVTPRLPFSGADAQENVKPPVTMNTVQASRRPFPKWFDLSSLVAQAYAAPLVAILFHSLYVLRRGTGIHNAEIGGCYYYDGTTFELPRLMVCLACCAVAAIPVFVVLMLLRKDTSYRWLVWVACVLLWTWFLFANEVAIR